MTKTIFGIVGAAFLTAGAGAGTVYKMSKAPAVTVEAPVPSNGTDQPSNAPALDVDGERTSLKVGGTSVETDGDEAAVKAGNVTVRRNGKQRSVQVGDQVSVTRDGKSEHVKVGNIEVERAGGKNRVQIGGLVIDNSGIH
jgi:hypothetical protein